MVGAGLLLYHNIERKEEQVCQCHHLIMTISCRTRRQTWAEFAVATLISHPLQRVWLDVQKEQLSGPWCILSVDELINHHCSSAHQSQERIWETS